MVTEKIHNYLKIISIAVMVYTLNYSVSQAQEHPTEHPAKVILKGESQSSVTLEDVAAYTKDYVKHKSASGTFKILDKDTGEELLLKLDKVHRDRLSQIDSRTFFVCADFTSVEGKHNYDLDFFVEGTSKENLKVSEDKTSIHKADGKERYTWKLNKTTGLWEQKSVGNSDINESNTNNQSLKDVQLIQPEELVEILKTEKGKQQLILQIGVSVLYDQGHIPGSEYVGPASDPNGLQKLRKRVEKLPRDKFIILYCGCCPWKDCPNIKPAYQEMINQGFTNTKLLNLPSSFKSDWVAKGYPFEVKK